MVVGKSYAFQKDIKAALEFTNQEQVAEGGDLWAIYIFLRRIPLYQI